MGLRYQQQASFAGWDFTSTWHITKARATGIALLAARPDGHRQRRQQDLRRHGVQRRQRRVLFDRPGATPSGALAYGGTSQGAVNAGTYTIMPGGLASDQRYHITHTSGILTITPQPPAATPAPQPAAPDNRPDAATLARAVPVPPAPLSPVPAPAVSAASSPKLRLADCLGLLELRPGFIALPEGGRP